MGEPSIDSLHDPYEEQLSAARYKAERDQLRQRMDALEEQSNEVEDMYRHVFDKLMDETKKAKRLGKLVWRLQNRLARAHRREKQLRKGLREWREKVIDNGKIATDAMFALDKWADPKMYTHRATVLAADGKPLREGEKPYRVDNGKQVDIRRIDPSNGESCVFVGVDGRSYGYWLRPGQLTHERPALDADGVLIKVGDMVWYRTGAARGVVESIDAGSLMHTVRYRSDDGEEYRDAANDLTHQRPVLDADGVPIHEGDTVWNEVGMSFRVIATNPKNGSFEAIRDLDGSKCQLNARAFSHERPDSWERIEEDLGDEMAKQQCGSISPELACRLAGEFVRRCRALAEREGGE